jgi:hypothetical protein
MAGEARGGFWRRVGDRDRSGPDGGTLEKAAQMANHASTRTTQLYDRRRDEMSLDEIERVVIWKLPLRKT